MVLMVSDCEDGNWVEVAEDCVPCCDLILVVLNFWALIPAC